MTSLKLSECTKKVYAWIECTEWNNAVIAKLAQCLRSYTVLYKNTGTVSPDWDLTFHYSPATILNLDKYK